MPREYVVPDELRKNPLSKEPGGFVVTVIKESHTIVYHNVKNWKAYVSKVRKEGVRAILVDNLKVFGQ